MRILNIKTYCEKLKIDPISLSELDKPMISFNKEYLDIGTVVMFKDLTFGMYVPTDSEIFKKLKKEYFNSANDPKGIFVCYDSSDYNWICWLSLENYNDDLTYRSKRSIRNLDEYDIVRIYDEKVPSKDIDEDIDEFISTFVDNIVKFAKDAEHKYIERTT